MQKEASARIKINKLLEESGWGFEVEENGKINSMLSALGILNSELSK